MKRTSVNPVDQTRGAMRFEGTVLYVKNGLKYDGFKPLNLGLKELRKHDLQRALSEGQAVAA